MVKICRTRKKDQKCLKRVALVKIAQNGENESFEFHSIISLWWPIHIIREVNHDVYGKRQTAKMKLLPSLFTRCVYSRVKIFVFAMNSRRQFFHFCSLYFQIRRKELRIGSYLCRLPSAVNVMLNLSNVSRKRESEYHAVGLSLVSGLRLFSLSSALLRAFTSELFALTLS